MAVIDLIQNKRDELLYIAKQHGVTTIKLFGSVARAEEMVDSDIDFLVTTGPVVSSWFPAGLVLDLEELFGRPVDIVTESALHPTLREHVLNEAIPL